jgi:uncharacterized protein (TIGR00297 family)
LDDLQGLLGIATITIAACASLITKTLDLKGSFAGATVGLIIVLFGGFRWLIPLLAFFIVAGIFTRYKNEIKRQLYGDFGEVRSWQNVLANSFVASALAIAYWLTSSKPFAVAYLGAVGASSSDTLGTELGLLNPYPPRLIMKLKQQVPAGTSGAISPYGEVASLVGAGLVASIAWLVDFPGVSNLGDLLIILLAGFFGSTFDSLLGATVQASFKCTVCGKLTEKKVHCSNLSRLVSGIPIFNNHLVNFLASAAGAIVAGLASFLLFS